MKLKIILLITIIFSAGCSNGGFYSSPKKTVLPEGIRWLQSGSGNQLAYKWFRAEQDSKGIVLHFHGNQSDLDIASEKVSWLNEYGYDIFVFDYSGFGHSTGEAKDYILHQDALSVLKYIENIRLKSKKPLFVISTSTGGNIFLRALADKPLLLNGVLLDSSFGSYRAIASYTVNKWPLGFLYSWLSGLFIRDDYSISAVVDVLPQNPTLISHCMGDRVVPHEHSRKLYMAFEGEKELWLLNHCRHARAFTRDHPSYQDRLVGWLDKLAEDSSYPKSAQKN